jgi:LacI family transcriptional regulator
MEMLNGIVHHQRRSQPWAVSLFEEAPWKGDPCCWVRSREWQGVINRNNSPALVQTCVNQGAPLVDLTDSPPIFGVSKFRPDNQAIGEMGAAYFLKRRFRHFGFCGYSNHSWSGERRDGFVEELWRSRHGCEIFDVECPGELTPAWETGQIALLAAWLRCQPTGAAIMTCNDRRAQQVIRAARVAGLCVPDELVVLGANNNEICCELADLTISSVAINSFEAGRRAAEHLTDLMAGKQVGGIDVRIKPLGVVTRKSTDVLGVPDENVAAALNFIREHAGQGLTVAEVLGQISISRTSLECKFRRYIGRSPQAEIRRVQIARICQLLTETNLSLKEIADRTGFVHAEYMCVMFKRITGATLGQYRNKNAERYKLPAAARTG